MERATMQETVEVFGEHLGYHIHQAAVWGGGVAFGVFYGPYFYFQVLAHLDAGAAPYSLDQLQEIGPHLLGPALFLGVGLGFLVLAGKFLWCWCRVRRSHN